MREITSIQRSEESLNRIKIIMLIMHIIADPCDLTPQSHLAKPCAHFDFKPCQMCHL